MDVIVKDDERTLRPRPEEGRVRGLRRRREAGHHVDDDEPRRPRHQRARGAAAAAAGRDHPAPAPCEVSDTSGRIFIFFVDDLHLQFQKSGRVRELFEKISKTLIHEGDLFGIVSSGPSSISIDMTYDKKRLDEAIKKIHGDGLKPSEIIQRGGRLRGADRTAPSAHVAFSTMLEGLDNLEKVHNRRKALVWVSEGYDFNPFQDSRYGLLGPELAVPAEPVEPDAQRGRIRRQPDEQQTS